jgi:hypothetical protein
VVVKPTVSGGGRDTGRFGHGAHASAIDLIRAIGASGRTAMVQPYLQSVGTEGEAAVVFVDGRFSHGLRKRAVLTRESVAPTRDDRIGAAEAMYDPDLVTAATPTDDELVVAPEIVDYLARRFEGPPLYARVDLARDADGAPLVLELERWSRACISASCRALRTPSRTRSWLAPPACADKRRRPASWGTSPRR